MPKFNIMNMKNEHKDENSKLELAKHLSENPTQQIHIDH